MMRNRSLLAGMAATLIAAAAAVPIVGEPIKRRVTRRRETMPEVIAAPYGQSGRVSQSEPNFIQRVTLPAAEQARLQAAIDKRARRAARNLKNQGPKA